MPEFSRRDVACGSVAVLLAAAAARASPRERKAAGPSFWRLRRKAGEVTLLGFGDAKDLGWFSSALRRAFDSCEELWLETAPQDVQAKPDPAVFMQMMQRMNLKDGTLFDRLDPSLAVRLRSRLSDVGLAQEKVAKLQPWWAYYQINGAWWAKYPPPYKPAPVDTTLAGLAKQAGKRVNYEFASFPAFVEFMSSLSDKAQSQYLEWLLDNQDAQKSGKQDPFGWLAGGRPTASFNRMERLPELYEAMQQRRNKWWADNIADLLSKERNAFVAVGQLHVMGRAGIPAQLARIGLNPMKLS